MQRLKDNFRSHPTSESLAQTRAQKQRNRHDWLGKIMGDVVHIDQKDQDESIDLKLVELQFILNMALDPELKPSAFKAAVYLLVGPRSGPRGECFVSDHDLAQCIGISSDTVATTVVKSHAFNRYFVSDRGKNRTDATDYRVQKTAVLGGIKRKNQGLSWLVRSDGTEVQTNKVKNRDKKHGKITGFNDKGGDFSERRVEETRDEARRKHPPTQITHP